MGHGQSKVEKYEKFTWIVENFSHLKKTKQYVYSEPVVLCGYPWRILIYPKGNKQEDSLSIYLDAVETANMSEGWSREVKFRLVVFNQFDSKVKITKECYSCKLNAKEYDWGWASFMYLGEFNDPQKGFLFKDTCIIGAEVYVGKVTNEKQVIQTASLTASLTSSGQIGHTEVEAPIEPTKCIDVELFSASVGDLMDFRGLGQVEKAFVPLLEEVCSHHPSLIESHRMKSPKFTGWAFNALGRVLYFLKTKNVKDMNDQCCKDLQTLWEELKTFEFDMTWLESHVQSILGMKSYVEKAIEVQQMKVKLIDAEVNLDAEKDYLLKAKGIQVSNLDAKLGYGSWEAKSMK